MIMMLMMTRQKFFNYIFFVVALMIVFITYTNSLPMSRYLNNNYSNELDDLPDDVLIELFARLGQSILRARNDIENSKRTVDFGLTRGYSGTSEARHRMGMASANSPAGPGRRRRSPENDF